MEILATRELTFAYPQASSPAVDRVSMTVSTGEFFVLCGQSGCGKTTLLRQLKPQLAPHGERSGEVLFEGRALSSLSERESSSGIGFVMQSPENQIVTDKVWHELAFGLESLGCDTPTVRRRVAEMASFFGIEDWFYKDVALLSGGEQQLLNLASVMVMQPRLLILDEPTAQLDPIAASDFLGILKKINRELGTTVILTEHRLEEALPLADRAAVMERGRLICCGSASQVGTYLREYGHPMLSAMPAAMRIWSSVDFGNDCPVSVNEGRRFLDEYTSEHQLLPLSERRNKPLEKEIISVGDVWYRYDRDTPDVLKGLSLTAAKGELLCILGGNGTGKTTLLKLMAGIKTPHRGKIITAGRTAYLPQDPRTLFVKKALLEDLEDAMSDMGLSKEEKKKKLSGVMRLCRLGGYEDRHPYDLSGGEQQRAALAKLLLREPDILLLDEPTKGLDAGFKAELAEILRGAMGDGCTVIVSHDVEFCAEYADRCALLFDGSIVADGAPREFFSGNSFYTTSANRIARDKVPEAVTVGDVIEVIGGDRRTPADGEQWGKYISDGDENDKGDDGFFDTDTAVHDSKSNGLPLWRRICGGIGAAASSAIVIYSLRTGILSRMVGKDGPTSLGMSRLGLYGVLAVLMIITWLLLGGRGHTAAPLVTETQRRRLSRRTLISAAVVLLLVPFTLYVGIALIDRSQYYLTAAAVLIECMLPFFMVFESRRPRARELVVIAVLCALSIAGRAAFFMLPQFKPVLAMTIIAGVALGGETGFLVGAVTMLVSNMMFSQGPWTPWQMFAMGIVGFLAGLLYRRGLLRRTRASLCTFGALSAILIYGGIMNPASALMWGSESLNFKMILSYYITGFPMDAIHALATVIFLLILSGPMLEKLDRIKVKYGLTE